MNEPSPPVHATASRQEDLSILLTRLLSESAELVETKIELVELELTERFKDALRQGIMLGVAGAVLLIGIVLASVAGAFLVSGLFRADPTHLHGDVALGCLIVALPYLGTGGFLIWKVRRRARMQTEPLSRAVAQVISR